MFTGLGSEVGVVKSVQRIENGLAVSVQAPGTVQAVQIGDSVAVNGVCSTVISCCDDLFSVQYSMETLSKTTVKNWRTGKRVNLELSLTPLTRMGGHIVTGHVDCVGKAVLINQKNGFAELVISYDSAFAHLLIQKGSVTVEGISLTIADLKSDRFSVHLIPHTVQNTHLQEIKSGYDVNLEFDVIGKYLYRFQEVGAEKASSSGDDQLKEALYKAGYIHE